MREVLGERSDTEKRMPLLESMSIDRFRNDSL